MNNKPHMVLMSCEPSNEPHLEQMLTAQGLRYSVGIGSYKGQEEKSFLVVLSNNDLLAKHSLERLECLATVLNQESILYLDTDRMAYLIYTDGSEHAPVLGHFESVPFPSGDAWSYFSNTYYEVK